MSIKYIQLLDVSHLWICSCRSNTKPLQQNWGKYQTLQKTGFNLYLNYFPGKRYDTNNTKGIFKLVKRTDNDIASTKNNEKGEQQ